MARVPSICQKDAVIEESLDAVIEIAALQYENLAVNLQTTTSGVDSLGHHNTWDYIRSPTYLY